MNKNDNMEIFENLKTFCNEYIDKVIDDIKIFIDLLPQFVFYISYIEFVKTAEQNGIPVCKPVFDDSGFTASDCAGISLILKFLMDSQPLDNIIRNDIRLPKSGIFILSGPNQGGKTIYLKALGLSAYLAKCGCYVFCKECRIPFYDNILTHFMQKEVLGKSRLVEEIERIEKIAGEFNRDSLVLLNESFTSTRRKDSLEIAMHYIKNFDKIGCSVGFVSHFYEIPEIYNNGENGIISLRSGIGGNGTRTYKISEQKSDGLAYARDIAKNCGMTYEQLVHDIQNINNGGSTE
jgi:DNA mismatch repair ATPase MutS